MSDDWPDQRPHDHGNGAAERERQHIDLNATRYLPVAPPGVQTPKEPAVASADFRNQCGHAAARRQFRAMPHESDVVFGVVSHGNNHAAHKLQIDAEMITVSREYTGFDDVLLGRRRAWIRQRGDQLT